ncbi:aminopeptidase. Metallo peptidase. MEROPS family M42 [Anaerobranca californiensis DSM 14826]|jgi:endoglucanase|uniref:Aminopeptidase. Metallo peptidase. MEROPS family M42 n=1 Tax=Anaerobranca californiensis DSM 14826 TaxID=1120989 RepID=A0A1M6K8G1_9FIRM|nr:M42 family metallopeptidase [Anaerobranca californiensis]SHJ55137.1 aminopeptidase. Metallo peptidase. MEROPS family M42 [Anaerobranca californiensis DSM 14826]
MNLELLKRLTEAPGIAGREERIRSIVIDELNNYVDEIKVDAIGNVIAFKKGKGNNPKKVMISAHMDEIGFIVSYIDDKGFLRLNPVGGFDPRTLVSQRVKVHGREELDGVLMPGVKPVHLMTPDEAKKPLTVSDFFVDIGRSKEEVEKLVRIGDFVTLERNFIEIGDNFSAKALDDRAGVYIMIEAIKKLGEHDVDIYAVGSVQEEVGLRGATTSAFGVQPDIGVALDVTIAGDIPGGTPHGQITALGNGAAIKIMDSASISNYKLVDFMRSLAEENNIKYQMEILPRGGTDAGAIERAKTGCPVITLSLPTRYVHSNVETANKQDLQNTILLLVKFLENAHKGDFTL